MFQEKKLKLMKSHHQDEKDKVSAEDFAKPIFGVALHLAVERHRSHDGIQLPVVVRMCIDYIEEQGLMQEGIYRYQIFRNRSK